MIYQTVKAGNTVKLEQAVNAACASGDWEPLGGPTYDYQGYEWVQALRRTSPAAPNGEVKLREPDQQKRKK